MELAVHTDGIALRESDEPGRIMTAEPGALAALVRHIKGGTRTRGAAGVRS